MMSSGYSQSASQSGGRADDVVDISRLRDYRVTVELQAEAAV